jgi:murein L,D-transpeptidase YcbB/YkuD
MCVTAVGGTGDTFAETVTRHPTSVGSLQIALETYRLLEKRGGWPVLPDGEPLRVGSFGPSVVRLKERLSITGDLPPPGSHPPEFDETLSAAVMRFQARHGLAVDGVVGQRTRAALNVAVGDRVRQIAANLARLRALPDTAGQRMILINIAGFELDVIENGKAAFNSPVIVGRLSRPTPALSSAVTRIIVNPYWRVPRRIAVRDILPQIRRDPSYLWTHGFRVFDASAASQVEVVAETVDWRSLNANNFPYFLVQDPGPLNALGQVKFFLPNEQDIFIHDTPARDLFKHKSRAFSSGCIRVGKAVELAEYLLTQEGEIALEAMAEALKSGETRQIALTAPVPLYVLYLTAWTDEAGRVHFRDDIYGLDAVVAAAEAPQGRARRDVARAYDTVGAGCAVADE